MTKIFHAEQNCKVLHERKRLGNFNCARVPNWYILVLILQLFHITRSLQILAYMRINISSYLRSYNIWSLLYRINVMENAFQIPFLNTFWTSDRCLHLRVAYLVYILTFQVDIRFQKIKWIHILQWYGKHCLQT